MGSKHESAVTGQGWRLLWPLKDEEHLGDVGLSKLNGRWHIGHSVVS